MDHISNIGSLFRLALISLQLPETEATGYVREKVKRSWNKLTPQAKNIMRQKYEAALTILEE